MKNRKKGFSLVELLIVLAVMAALIATITPVALNAIKKSKATQVAQNLKTLASAIENKGYVDGTNVFTSSLSIKNLARDIKTEDYGAYILTGTNGQYTVTVFHKGTDADYSTVLGVLQGVTEGPVTTSTNGFFLNDGLSSTNSDTIKYVIQFTIY